MSDTTIPSLLTPEEWDDNFFMEFVHENPYTKYQGTTDNSIFQLKEAGDKAGRTVGFTTVRKLRGSGVQDNEVLEGNEDELDLTGLRVRWKPERNAVKFTNYDETATEVGLQEVGKEANKTWALEKHSELVRASMSAMKVVDGRAIPYAEATPADRNTWLTNNYDRALFGALNSNTVVGNFAASLLNVDNTSDRLTPALISTAKRKALAPAPGNPRIRPYRVGTSGRTSFVMFCNRWAFRDLQQNAQIQTFMSTALERGIDNPLWTGGDLLWDNVVIVEDPDLPTLPGVGTGGVEVGANYLCGAQAFGVVWKKRPKSIFKDFDYGFRHGIGIEQWYGASKLMFATGANPEVPDKFVDHGLVTVYAAAVPDA